MENIKFKPLNIEQIMISVDRLTRFKDPETKYLRVFKDIICSHLISPKYKKTDLDNFDYTKLRDIAEFINSCNISLSVSVSKIKLALTFSSKLLI